LRRAALKNVAYSGKVWREKEFENLSRKKTGGKGGARPWGSWYSKSCVLREEGRGKKRWGREKVAKRKSLLER